MFYVQFTIQTLDKITSVSTGYRDSPVYCLGEKEAKFELFAGLCITKHNQRLMSYFLGPSGVSEDR